MMTWINRLRLADRWKLFRYNWFKLPLDNWRAAVRLGRQDLDDLAWAKAEAAKFLSRDEFNRAMEKPAAPLTGSGGGNSGDKPVIVETGNFIRATVVGDTVRVQAFHAGVPGTWVEFDRPQLHTLIELLQSCENALKEGKMADSNTPASATVSVADEAKIDWQARAEALAADALRSDAQMKSLRVERDLAVEERDVLRAQLAAAQDETMRARSRAYALDVRLKGDA